MGEVTSARIASFGAVAFPCGEKTDYTIADLVGGAKLLVVYLKLRPDLAMVRAQ